MKYIILIATVCSMSLVGCRTTPPAENPVAKYSVFPVEPSWQAFSKPPIRESVDGADGETYFIVTDELIKKTIQQTKYIDRVKDWRIVNSIP